MNERAIEEMKNTARAVQKFGVDIVNGFTGSSIWHLLYSFPPVPESMIQDGFDLSQKDGTQSSMSLGSVALNLPWKYTLRK